MGVQHRHVANLPGAGADPVRPAGGGRRVDHQRDRRAGRRRRGDHPGDGARRRLPDAACVPPGRPELAQVPAADGLRPLLRHGQGAVPAGRLVGRREPVPLGTRLPARPGAPAADAVASPRRQPALPLDPPGAAALRFSVRLRSRAKMMPMRSCTDT